MSFVETPGYIDDDNFREIGRSTCTFQSPVPYKHSVYWKRALEKDPNLGKFDWPSRSVEAEKISYRIQCSKHQWKDVYVPNKEEIAKAHFMLDFQYVKHSLPDFWLQEDLVSGLKVGISEYKNYLKNDSTPGVPYALTAGRNDQLLEILGERFDDLVLARVLARMEYTLEEIQGMSRRELLEKNLMDPVRVFVKGEPHKLEKIKQGRVRLIMSVSIVDKMVEMLYMRHLAKLEIRNWRTIPSKPGIGFTVPDVRSVYDDVMLNKPMAATDIEAWDWSCQYWQLREEAEGAIKLCLNSRPEWEHLVRVTAWIEANSVYQFSDGTLVENCFQGIVNSGKYKTSRGNSYMRSFLAALVGCYKCNSAGDDTIEKYVDEAVKKYAKFGFRIKVYEWVDETFEFCSRVYTRTGSWPVNYEKILMNLLHNEPKTPHEFRMYMTGFLDDMEFHPNFNNIMRLVEDVGYLELAGAQEIVDESDTSFSSSTTCATAVSETASGTGS